MCCGSNFFASYDLLPLIPLTWLGMLRRCLNLSAITWMRLKLAMRPVPML